MTAVSSAPTSRPAFGTAFGETMTVAAFRDGKWGPSEVQPTAPIPIHPAAHVLHYASTCFDGFKAYRWADGSIHVFRMDRNIERLRQSARGLALPEPDTAQLTEMVRTAIESNRSAVPEAPGSLYIRPMLIGTTPNIGAAASPATDALLIVLVSPVWDYFASGMRPLRIFVDSVNARTAGVTGSVKTGGNYAAALVPTLQAREKYKADQVLFAPGGKVQETGAANFLLFAKGRLLTRSLDSTILHGITRDSLLTLARDDGWKVEERVFDVREMLDWVGNGEAALAGTAAVLTGVGVLIYEGKEYKVGDGDVGEITRAMRKRLTSIQHGESPDPHGWLTKI